MCASAMQAQAAEGLLLGLHFKMRVQVSDDERTIYPLQPMAFGRLNPATGEREALLGQFGLVPDWVTAERGGAKFGRNCYNARTETVFEKPSFRKAILARRAVVPVEAFYDFPDTLGAYPLTLSADYTNSQEATDGSANVVAAGLEWEIQTLLAVEAGYRSAQTGSLGGTTGLSAGLELRYDGWRVGYAYSGLGDLGAGQQVEIGVGF